VSLVGGCVGGASGDHCAATGVLWTARRRPLGLRYCESPTSSGLRHRRPTPSNWNRALKRACEATGHESISAYDCRHACATTWLRAGVPLGEVALRLGHSVETLVSYYVGAIQGDDLSSNELIEQTFQGQEWSPGSPSQAHPTDGGQSGPNPVNRPQAADLPESAPGAVELRYPRPESNWRTRFRKPMLYPLSYGGSAIHVSPREARPEPPFSRLSDSIRSNRLVAPPPSPHQRPAGRGPTPG